ncbi:MAG: hypothetical protein AB8G99_09345, partial [Planctomycetaceae bacterium]
MPSRFVISVATLLLFAGMNLPCQVPVFRYALERWEPDAHELLILTDRPLSDDETQLLEQLAPDPVSGKSVANVRVRIVDGSDDGSARLIDQWKTSHPEDKLPQVVVRSPDIKQQRPVIWSGSLNQDSIDQLVDSNARQALAEELVDGTSAVWVLLKSGNAAADQAAEATLRQRLAHNEASMKLSMPDAEDIAEGFDPEKLKLKFAVLTVDRNDPKEAFLVQSLLNVETDLRDDEYAAQPMAFPVFGRGRALYALIGKGITADVIDEACLFLIGPCSCQVKDQNPGVDLLLAVDWDSLVETSINTDVELPPLMGLSSFGRPEQNDDSSDDTAETTGVVVQRIDSQETTPETSEIPSDKRDNLTTVEPDAVSSDLATDTRSVLFGVLAVGLLGILTL